MAGLAPGAARRAGRLPWTGRCPDETVGGEEEPGEPLPEELDSSWVNFIFIFNFGCFFLA